MDYNNEPFTKTVGGGEEGGEGSPPPPLMTWYKEEVDYVIYVNDLLEWEGNMKSNLKLQSAKQLEYKKK